MARHSVDGDALDAGGFAGVGCRTFRIVDRVEPTLWDDEDRAGDARRRGRDRSLQCEFAESTVEAAGEFFGAGLCLRRRKAARSSRTLVLPDLVRPAVPVVDLVLKSFADKSRRLVDPLRASEQ